MAPARETGDKCKVRMYVSGHWAEKESLERSALCDPKMYESLMAYRESIVRLAKRHPWQQVVKYNRKFRRETARRNDVK